MCMNNNILGKLKRPASGAAERTAFTLVEILIVVLILGILASIIIPQFSNASHEAREHVLRDDLRFLRHQIEVYKLQHRDVAPGYIAGVPSAAAFTSQMTLFTDEYGATNASKTSTYKFGPYLRQVPENPINGKTSIRVLQDGDALPVAATDNDGWVFKPATAAILADSVGSDGTGADYFSY
jgi:general secretion pathway protein G